MHRYSEAQIALNLRSARVQSGLSYELIESATSIPKLRQVSLEAGKIGICGLGDLKKLLILYGLSFKDLLGNGVNVQKIQEAHLRNLNICMAAKSFLWNYREMLEVLNEDPSC